MQINTDYWGGADKRTSLYGGTFEITNYDLMTALNDGDLPFNEPLDTSISPWSINGAADAVALAYPLGCRVAGENKAIMSWEVLNDEVDSEVNGVPFYFAMPNYNGNGGFNFNWFARNGYSQAQITGNPGVSFRDMVYPVTKFDYSRFAYYLQLVVADYKIDDVTNESSFWSVSNTSMDTYFGPNYDTFWKDKPILGIKMVPYYATSEDYPNNRTAIELLMNSIGLKTPMTYRGAGLNGYDIDYLDDFMTLNKCNTNTGAASIGTYGAYAFYTIGDNGTWATDIASSIDYNYGVDRYNLQIAHVGNSDFWEMEEFWTGAYTIYYRTELKSSKFANKQAFMDYILKQAAYYGTWFCTDYTDIQSTEPGSTDNWYLGEIGEDGITTGHYEQGANTTNLDNSTWTDPWEDSGWKGRSDDPTPYDKDLQSRIAYSHYDPSRGTADYLMTDQALSELIAVLNYYKVAEANGDVPEGTCVTLFGTTDPFECINNIIYYPVDLDIFPNSDWAGSDDSPGIDGIYMAANQGVYVGNTELVVTTDSPIVDPDLTHIHVYSYKNIKMINWGGNTDLIFQSKPLNYFQRYHSFLDYEPYCSAELYVPFCGSVKIDPEIFVGNKIGVTYTVSPTDGTIRADIYRNGLNVDSLTGNMGTQITLVTSDIVARTNAVQQQNSIIQAQKANAIKALAGFALGTAATLATGGAAGAATTALTAKRGIALGSAALGAVGTLEGAHRSIQAAEYQIKNAEIPFKQLLTGSGFLASTFEPAIRLVIYRPTFIDGYTRDNFGDYGHTVGFACLKYETLNNFNGLTVCSSVDLSGVACTAKEAEMIKSALQTGVYLPVPSE